MNTMMEVFKYSLIVVREDIGDQPLSFDDCDARQTADWKKKPQKTFENGIDLLIRLHYSMYLVSTSSNTGEQ